MWWFVCFDPCLYTYCISWQQLLSFLFTFNQLNGWMVGWMGRQVDKHFHLFNSGRTRIQEVLYVVCPQEPVDIAIIPSNNREQKEVRQISKNFNCQPLHCQLFQSPFSTGVENLRVRWRDAKMWAAGCTKRSFVTCGNLFLLPPSLLPFSLSHTLSLCWFLSFLYFRIFPFPTSSMPT